MSRRGTSGRISRFLVTNDDAAISLALFFLVRPRSASSAGLLVQHDRLDPAPDDLLVDEDLLDVPLRGDGVHEVEHQIFQDDAQAARAHVALKRLARHRLERLVRELQLHSLELQDGLVLPDQAVLGLVEDAHQRLLVELLQRRHHRQTADELRDQPVLDQILGQDVLQELARLLVALPLDVGAEAERLLVHAALDDILEAHEGAAADEQDVGGVDLQELLVGVLAPALRRHVALRPLEDLEQRLLHPFARDVAGDRRVVALAADLVHLIDIDDAALRLLLVVPRRLVELEDDVLDVLADVAGFGEGGGVGDGERHREQARQRLGEQRLARAGGADQQDVRLLELDLAVRLLREVDPLVVVVDRDRQLLLGLFLADHVLVEERLDLLGLGERRVLLLLEHPVLGDDVEADVDALIADEHGRASDELLDLALALVAERAPQDFIAAVFLRHFSSVVTDADEAFRDARCVAWRLSTSCPVEQDPRRRVFPLLAAPPARLGAPCIYSAANPEKGVTGRRRG